MIVTINCKNCGAGNTMVLLKPEYEGPFSCYKCHGLSTIKVRNGNLESWAPLTQEELRKQKEVEDLKAKLKARLPRNIE